MTTSTATTVPATTVPTTTGVHWIDSHTTELVRSDGWKTRCKHATHRAAQVYVATERLRAAGWHVRGPSSTDGFRLPLLLEGERMCAPLNGARTDERAQGFTATKGDAVLRVDACADGDAEVVLDEGDTNDAWDIVSEIF